MKDKIAKKLGYVSWNDFIWTWVSIIRTPRTQFEKLLCKLFGHAPNEETMLGKDWSDETMKTTVTSISTYCKRCLKILSYKLI